MANKPSFEENLTELEKIVANLEQGDIPLEEALSKFQKGVKLSQDLEKTLTSAQQTLTKVMTDAGQEVNFEGSDSENHESTAGQGGEKD